MNNIILIGFMGAGKTTVGMSLAKERHMQFVDTDERIVKEQKQKIPEIFATFGESYFRDLETNLLRHMQSDTNDSVISVGGGMPVREENRKLLRELGYVVFLSASKETILSRVKNDGSRPMLNGEDLESRVEYLMRERKEFYEETAHFIVQTDKMDIPQVVKIICQKIDNKTKTG